MMKIHSYLTFNGNCREAMKFYQECLGGDLEFQTIGDSPLAQQMPDKMKSCILHSTLNNGTLLLMASDMVDDNGLQKGNSVSLALQCNSETELKNCYQKLAVGGTQNHPVEVTPFGMHLGDLTDQFGNHWILNFRP